MKSLKRKFNLATTVNEFTVQHNLVSALQITLSVKKLKFVISFVKLMSYLLN